MIFMENKAISSGPVEFPDEPGVAEFYEARGWVKVDAPAPTPFVPPRGDAAADTQWVSLTHSVTGAVHDFPNHPDAIKGAADAGWLLPEAPEEEPPPKPSKKASTPPKDGENDT